MHCDGNRCEGATISKAGVEILATHKKIAVVKVKTEGQSVDILTKGLRKKLFVARRNYLLNEQ